VLHWALTQCAAVSTPCLDVSQRYTAEEALRDPWVRAIQPHGNMRVLVAVSARRTSHDRLCSALPLPCYSNVWTHANK
jgi:hypothetical protein